MSVSLQDLQILSVIIRVRDDNPTPESRRKLFSADHYLIESRGISDDMGNPTGFLASSPWVFYGMGNVATVSSDRLDEMLRVHGLDADFVMTNRGIRIRLPIQHLQDCAKTYIAFIACGQLRPPTLFAIYLRQVSGNRFTRMRPSHVYTPLQSDLLEIPLSAIVRLNEIRAENFLVDVSQKQAQSQRRKPYTVWLDVAPLCHILQQRGFIILDKSWNREFRKWYILTGQDVFLIVLNGFEEPELMLVISLEDDIGIATERTLFHVSVADTKIPDHLPDVTHVGASFLGVFNYRLGNYLHERHTGPVQIDEGVVTISSVDILSRILFEVDPCNLNFT